MGTFGGERSRTQAADAEKIWASLIALPEQLAHPIYDVCALKLLQRLKLDPGVKNKGRSQRMRPSSQIG